MSARVVRNGALLLAVATTLSACPRAQRPARDRIRFAHAAHMNTDATCVTCHPGATEAGGPLAALVPPEEKCLSCHTTPEERACRFCHTVPARPETYPRRRRRVRFDHVQHDAPMQGKCVRCHGGGASGALADFDVHLPEMATCTNRCHAPEMRTLRCTPCHVDLHDYAIEEVAVYRHPAGFLRGHGSAARADQGLCTSCHEPSFCEDCHMEAAAVVPLELIDAIAVTRAFVHRGDFRARHAMEARMERGTCLRCHGVTYCDDCHRESGVGGSVAANSPHPPGWLDPLSPNGHAAEARRDILSCAGCHERDAERTCVPCHRVGGVASNPHPPGFGVGMDPMRHAVCRACHVP